MLQVKTITCRIMMTLIFQMMLCSVFYHICDFWQLIRAINHLLPSPAWPALKMLLSLKMLPVYKPVDPSKRASLVFILFIELIFHTESYGIVTCLTRLSCRNFIIYTIIIIYQDLWGSESMYFRIQGSSLKLEWLEYAPRRKYFQRHSWTSLIFFVLHCYLL